ncbi:uncharacterized protein T551_01626 [Pneumocystis jirovecii RU7]|uniref:RNA-binding protein VTS1 n=1 Tax=Pneumocystis jirovecii (strain RU7) TaxID=1408657 RepID=A0A0W4ZRU3_PNEJ7|nr:uncharacterized protein T551_01626 [Pneumocystis jirovecii RU7]KTW31074.1 hypothetical protein T551_01626 [Pneumocystis jirovecii RU7]
MSITPTPEHHDKSSLKHLTSKIQLNPQLRTSFDLSNYNSPISVRGNRPTSEVFVRTPQKTQMPEVAAFDKWLEDLQSYENTLEEMESASLDQNFKEELGAIEQWFRVLSEAERTAALYSLLHQATQVQIRFFITILQQMARNDPMNAFLSPANLDKDYMKNSLSSAINQLSLDRKNGVVIKPLSPSINHSSSVHIQNGSHLEAKTINAMFQNAPTTLASQKTRLSTNCNTSVFNSTHNQDTVSVHNNNSPILLKQDTLASPLWSQSLNKIPESTPLELNRPKSVDIGKIQNTQQMNPHIIDNSISNTDYGEFSPFSPAGNWASMVNTPAVPMFSQAPSQNSDLLKGATSKLASLSSSIQNSDPVILDTDVKKYRRGKNILLSSITDNNGYGSHPTNTLMYTEHGHLMQVPSQRSVSSPLLLRKISPKSDSSIPPGFTETPGWHVSASSQSNGYLAPFEVSSPLLSVEEYISDNSDAITTNRKGRRVTSKPPENPVNDLLLNDIPAWLRGLRLHKYSDNLGDMNWEELIEMTDEQLEMKGVAALGARRKLLKSFDQIKEARSLGKF